MGAIQFTPKLCYLVQFTSYAICQFCFSMRKFDFNLRFCGMVVGIKIYIKKIMIFHD
jgi:hypothetical protein